MSLFEDDRFTWRETYFVLFQEENRPTAGEFRAGLEELGPQYRIENVVLDDRGRCDSLTLFSPDDYAAMDISYVSGPEVEEQLEELMRQVKSVGLAENEADTLDRIGRATARYDLFHFEQIVYEALDTEEEFLDPGALLVVLEKITELCRGVGVDPASGTVVEGSG